MNNGNNQNIIYANLSPKDLRTFTTLYYNKLKIAISLAQKYDYIKSEFIINVVNMYLFGLNDANKSSLLGSIFEFYQSSKFYAYLREINLEVKDRIVSNFSTIFNLQDLETALVLGQFDEVKFNPDYCFKCQNRSLQNENKQGGIWDLLNYKEYIPTISLSYNFYAFDYVRLYSNYVVDAVLFFKSNNCRNDKLAIFFKFSDKHNKFRFGLDPVCNNFFDLKKLNELKNSKVIIFLDIFVSLNMRKLAHDYNLCKTNGIILSGILCKDDLDSLDYSILRGHDVVVVPCCEKKSLLNIEIFIEKCNKFFARSVKVFPWPVIDDEDSVKYSPWTCLNLYEKLLSHAIYFKNFEVPRCFKWVGALNP